MDHIDTNNLKNLALYLLLQIYMKNLVTVFTLLFLLASCQQKKSTGARANLVNSGNSGITSLGGSLGACNSTSQVVGTIFDGGTNVSGSFQDRVVALLSATVLPQDVGTVSSAANDASGTGIRFTGSVKLNQTGAVVAAQSSVEIDVYDSIWLQNKTYNPTEEPIKLGFSVADGSTLSGQFNLTTGQGYLVLKDQYGQIRFDGQLDAQYFSGTISFANTSSVSGTAASGTLGQFKTLTCGFFSQ